MRDFYKPKNYSTNRFKIQTKYPRVVHQSKFKESLNFIQLNTSSLGTVGVGLAVWNNKLYIANRNTIWQYDGNSLFTDVCYPVLNQDIRDKIYSIHLSSADVSGIGSKLVIGCSHVGNDLGVVYYEGAADGWVDLGGSFTDPATVVSLCSFAGEIYCGTTDTSSSIGEIYKRDTGVGDYVKVGVLTGSTKVDRLLAHSNGTLYALISDGANSYCYYRSADNNWPDTELTASGLPYIYDGGFIEYRDCIYAAPLTEAYSPFQYYDTSWHTYTLSNDSTPTSFAIYEDRMYISCVANSPISKNRIYKEISTLNNYIYEFYDGSTPYFVSMINFDGKIFGLSSAGSIFCGTYG